MPSVERKNTTNLPVGVEPQKSSSLLGRPVKWLRGDTDRKGVLIAKRALAGLIATFLAISLIGIIPLVFGVKKWKELKPQAQKVPTPLPSLQMSSTSSLSYEVQPIPPTSRVQTTAAASKSSEKSSSSSEDYVSPPEDVVHPPVSSEKKAPKAPQSFEESSNSSEDSAEISVETAPVFEPPAIQDVAEEVSLIKPEDCRFNAATREEVLALQGKLRHINKKHEQIQLESLEALDRLPKHKLVVEGVTYYCSNLFKNERNVFAFALVELKGKVYPRLFYLSGSQGTWRVAPYAEKRVFFGLQKVSKLGKGLAENDTQLPIPIALALQTLPLPMELQNIGKIEDLLQTVGPMEVLPKYSKGVKLEEFLSQAPSTQEFEEEQYLMPFTDNPGEIVLPNALDLPDFTKMFEMEVNLEFYGKCTAKYMPSINGTNYYLFYENAEGYAFLASLEKVRNNPIGKFGVRKTAWELHHLDAPLLEYRMQIPRRFKTWANLAFEQQKYWNNWNYVREIPLIKLYYEKTGRALPEPFKLAHPNG